MDNIAKRLSALSSSAVVDARNGLGVLGTGLMRLNGTGTVAGRAITAACVNGSSLGMAAALAHAKPGDVLCASAESSWAYIGDLLGTNIAMRGVVAVVIDGCVRDIATLRTTGVTYLARGVTAAVQRNRQPAPNMVPVTLGATTVAPGDWIVADDDGAVVIPAAELDTVLAKAEAIAEQETRILALIRQGMSISDAFAAVTEKK